METKGSIQYSQETANCPYSERRRSKESIGKMFRDMFRSLDSSVGIVTVLRAGRFAVQISEKFKSALGPKQPPIQWIPGFFPGVKATGAWC
jgi:hypothetical protein